ncbi:two-component system response regulator [Planctomycetaceae bacterium SCGC AG-212-F19]|nr:two-component system response regulator [Planctomycetaceae bacterium SCGC AG-212-F19]
MTGEPLVILFVEDDANHAELVLRSFQENQLANRVVHLTDGAAALDYLFRSGPYADPATSPTPHLILLDLRLPKIDGLVVLRQIKEADHLRRIPVVILTTSQTGSDLADAYDRHANSYLVKPVDFAKLIQLVRDLKFYWLAWNHPPEHP